jgi:outer membrane biogenesis lipoprotein LolB
MHLIKTAAAAVAIGLLAACATPQEKAANAQAEASKAQAANSKQQEKIAKQRLDLVSKYQACVKDAGSDQQKAAACDSYLKAAEALK